MHFDMDTNPSGVKNQRKESDPPSYESEMNEKESVTTRIWKKRVGIVYVILLVAVSAAAIYFAVASARLEKELKVKHVGVGHNRGSENVEERSQSKPPTVISIQTNQSFERDGLLMGGNNEDGLQIDEKKEKEFENDIMVNNKMLDVVIDEEAAIIKQVFQDFSEILTASVANCSWGGPIKMVSGPRQVQYRKTAQSIADNTLPFQRYLGIPKDEAKPSKKTKMKKSLQTMDYLTCIFHHTMLNNDITGVLKRLIDQIPETDPVPTINDEDSKENSLNDAINPWLTDSNGNIPQVDAPSFGGPFQGNGGPKPGKGDGPFLLLNDVDNNPFVDRPINFPFQNEQPINFQFPDGEPIAIPHAIPQVDEPVIQHFPVYENPIAIAIPYAHPGPDPIPQVDEPAIQNFPVYDNPIAMPYAHPGPDPIPQVDEPAIQNFPVYDNPIAMPYAHPDPIHFALPMNSEPPQPVDSPQVDEPEMQVMALNLPPQVVNESQPSKEIEIK